MKNILITGGTGFIGRNITPIINKNYFVFTPTRKELNLRNAENVKDYVISNKIDAIIHCANPNPVKNPIHDNASQMYEDSIRIFLNIYRIREFCEKIIYFGSGAEFNKQYDMKQIKESDLPFRTMPEDVYGCTKYIMNELASKTENIYNFRLFACYGPYDHESKFITHCIRCCIRKEPITIRQNCMFDYLHVYDLAQIILHAMESSLNYCDYNIASGRRISLKEIAQIVKEEMKSSQDIKIINSGWNKEYTPNISRLNELVQSQNFISLEKGIQMQIVHEQSVFNR